MVGENIKNNVSDRVDSVKSLLSGEVDAVKGFVGDIVERFDLDEDTTPNTSPPIGSQPDLADSALGVIVKTKDNVVKFIQTQASINRRWVSRRR